ncbi:O-antigen ligase [Clostridium saudiense]|uniref:O-antigen ligase family protein n=1 Tax=Clostridium saudiense TaxID=1414720 RepID=UPI000822683D|nr:O-antigen ligase family protein [Clostridium saudiense]MDU7453382.1 O-antigen ligase family protein [Clostridium saudiense]SCJ84160.1 Lipid A core-O-antigen ligase and related enzymes [uncultured Clostridium sp.]
MTKEYLFKNIYFNIFILFINTSVSDAFFEALFIQPSIISISRLITNLIFILMLIYYLLISRIKARQYKIGIILTILIGISLIWTPLMFESVKVYINVIGPICYFIIMGLVIDKGTIIGNLRAYSNILLFCEIISLVLPGKVGYMDSVEGILRGIHLSRSALVIYLNFCIFINFLYIIEKYKKSNVTNVFSIVVIGIASILVLLTKSSTGILIVMLFFLLIFLVNSQKIYRWIFTGSLALGIGIPLMNVNSPIIERLVEVFFGKTLTFSGRKYIWQYAISNLAKHPILGNGFNSTGELLRDKIIPIYEREASHTHNGFLEVFLQNGIVGLVLVVSIIVVAYKFVKYLPSIQQYIFRAYLIVFIIFNFMEPYLNEQVSVVNIWLPIAYIFTYVYKQRKEINFQ